MQIEEKGHLLKAATKSTKKSLMKLIPFGNNVTRQFTNQTCKLRCLIKKQEKNQRLNLQKNSTLDFEVCGLACVLVLTGPNNQ